MNSLLDFQKKKNTFVRANILCSETDPAFFKQENSPSEGKNYSKLMLSENLVAQLKDLLCTRHKMEAIVLLRREAGVSLQEAVETLRLFELDLNLFRGGPTNMGMAAEILAI